MSKFMKAIAALMLLVAVVCAAGCKKPDEPNEPNNGGNGENNGGNGGGTSPTTEGIYLGIIGFNYNLFPKEIGFLDNSTKSSFTSFIGDLTTENLTALYYADYTALKKLNQFGEPPRLTNVALVTFTDGLDNASLDDEERNPENYPTREAYLNALHNKIRTEQIHNLNVNAYTIGLRGNDVLDVAAFQNNLKKLASSDNNVYEVTSMEEALQRFEEIAESLHWISVTTSLTLLVPPGYDDGMVLRFTFDQGNSADNSSLCIECTYKRAGNERRLENIQYIGFEQGASSLSSVEKLPNGFYKFVFEQLEKVNGGGYITEEDRSRLKLYRKISTGWEPETEFDNSNQSSIVNEQNSALIMLVLDCTTSLGNQFSNLKTGAKNFVETLVDASNSGNNHRFTITVSANPTEGGTVSGGGTYNSGASRTVTATANDGYTFINWTENGNEVSTDANYSFTLNTNRNLVANFTASAPDQYTISVSANPTEGGTVSGGGTFDSGTSRTVTATANEGYTFTNWTENGNVVSTNASYTFTVNANRTLVANFTVLQPEEYIVNVMANPTEGGTVTGGGTYQQGEQVSVTATANAGYTFTNWTENGNEVSTDANYTFTLTADCTLIANFTANTPNQYTIEVFANPTEGGVVSGGGTYLQGQSCTVKATAAGGYTFQKWTENDNQVSTDANYTFTVTGNRTLVANFTPQILPPTVTTTQVTNITSTSAIGGGNVTNNGGGTVTERGVCWSTSHNPTISGSHVAASSGGNGSFTVPITGLTAGTTYYVRAYATNSVGTAYGTEVPFTTQYTISVSANPSNGGTVSGGGTYNQGASCTVHAQAATNYQFTNWTENGTVVSTQANYQFTVNSNRTLVANFTLQVTLPTVTTSQVTNIQQTTATGGGNVTNNGGATVTTRGICWSTSHNPTIANSHQSSGSGAGTFTANMSGLSPGTTYYVRAYATNSAGTAYGSEVSFTTLSSGGGHTYVDLGLPSGLLWATCNVGASSPEGYGYYYAWGETQPKSNYDWSTYQYCNGSYNTLTKYCNDASYGYNGYTDNLTTLQPGDDAATANWGSGWRMPTKEEWQELYQNTTHTWTTQNGVHGRLFTATNGNSLFLPAAGYRDGTSLYNAGSYGGYWSSSLYTDYPGRAWYLDFGSGYCYMGNDYLRHCGRSVRPVRSTSKN